jgi:hypothetical protein
LERGIPSLEVDVRLAAMLDAGRVYEIDESYRVGLPQDDEQPIATELTADEGDRVASALAAVRLYATTTGDRGEMRA